MVCSGAFLCAAGHHWAPSHLAEMVCGLEANVGLPTPKLKHLAASDVYRDTQRVWVWSRSTANVELLQSMRHKRWV
eukprot:1435107-Prymnesium_polylepis.2